jgi:peptidoglycan/LPS O-acetylase OafA/YrhL
MPKDSPNLDLLRSIAVAFVVISHLPFYVGWQPAPWFAMKALGHVGVAAFFVHTTLVLLQSLERSGDGAGAFFIRRAFRIYPLSVAVVLLMVALQAVGGVPLVLGDIASNLLLVQNLTGAKSIPDPLWTLPFEVQMYLVLPALFLAARSPRALRWVALLLVASVGAALAAGAWRTMTLVSFVPCFLPGALAFAQRNRQQRRSPGLLLAVIAAGAVLVPVLVAAGAPETPLLWALCLALGLTIPQCRQITSGPVARTSKTVATYSYGIYLTHVFALGLAFPVAGATTAVQWAIFAVLLPGLAVLAYRAVEAPGIALGRRAAAAYSARISAARPAAISSPASSA